MVYTNRVVVLNLKQTIPKLAIPLSLRIRIKKTFEVKVYLLQKIIQCFRAIYRNSVVNLKVCFYLWHAVFLKEASYQTDHVRDRYHSEAIFIIKFIFNIDQAFRVLHEPLQYFMWSLSSHFTVNYTNESMNLQLFFSNWFRLDMRTFLKVKNIWHLK